MESLVAEITVALFQQEEGTDKSRKGKRPYVPRARTHAHTHNSGTEQAVWCLLATSPGEQDFGSLGRYKAKERRTS